MKKRFLSLSLLSCLLFSCSSTQTDSSSSFPIGKPFLPEEEYPSDSSSLKECEVDPFEKKDHIFEAEAAMFFGYSMKSKDQPLYEKCIAHSYLFDLSFSDSVIVRNITRVGNCYAFEFHSSKSYLADLEISIASAYNGKFIERYLSKMYDVTINGKTLMEDVLIPKGDKSQIKQSNNYTAMQKVTFPIPLKEGKNVILFSSTDSSSNLDYINIRTSSEITSFTPNYWVDENTAISLLPPTFTKEGRIAFSCKKHGISNSFSLPILSRQNGYLVSQDEKEFSLCFNGEKITFYSDGKTAVPSGISLIDD